MFIQLGTVERSSSSQISVLYDQTCLPGPLHTTIIDRREGRRIERPSCQSVVHTGCKGRRVAAKGQARRVDASCGKGKGGWSAMHERGSVDFKARSQHRDYDSRDAAIPASAWSIEEKGSARRRPIRGRARARGGMFGYIVCNFKPLLEGWALDATQGEEQSPCTKTAHDDGWCRVVIDLSPSFSK